MSAPEVLNLEALREYVQSAANDVSAAVRRLLDVYPRLDDRALRDLNAAEDKCDRLADNLERLAEIQRLAAELGTLS